MRIQSVCCPKRRVWLSVFCGALLFTSTLSAQVNTERLRQTHGKTGYITSLGLDFNVLSGNSDKFEIAPNARLDYVSDYWNWFVVGNYKYGESAQKAFTNKGFLHWRINAPLDRSVSWEFFVQREFDEFRRITDRSLLGLALRMGLMRFGDNGENGTVYWGSGIMSEHEAYQSASPVDRLRWTNYVSGSYRHKGFSIASIWYVQPDLGDFGDVRALTDTSVSVGLTEQLSWRLGVKASYTSRPQATVKSYDVDIQNGIVWSF
jgi:hypothetical protein